MRCGVFLTRAQPFHRGHLKVVNKMLEENDSVLIIIGSANKSNTRRNPLSADDRLKFVLDAVGTLRGSSKVTVIKLDDWSMEDAYEYAREWGSYLYYNIVSSIHQKTFSFYYNDDIDVLSSWFEPYIMSRIKVVQLERSDDNISSTAIRQAILDDDLDYLQRVLTPMVFSYLPYIKDCILSAVDADFIMV